MLNKEKIETLVNVYDESSLVDELMNYFQNCTEALVCKINGKHQNEINQLKEQHAQDMQEKENLVKMQSEKIESLEEENARVKTTFVEIEISGEFNGYRQAVKDILGVGD